MQLSSNRVLRTIARVVEIIVALVFLLAALMKALDPQAFIEQIIAYRIFPELAPVAAWSFIVIECVLAAGLLVNLYPRIVPLLSAALLLFFIGITVYGMAIGLGENCGCFGNLYHRGPEMVIIEDTLMILGLLFATVVLWKQKVAHVIPRLVFALSVGALAALLTGLSPSIPADDFVTQLSPGQHFDTWPVDGLYGKDLNTGTHVVFLFTVTDTRIAAQVERMNAIAQQEAIASAVGLIIDGTEHLTALMFEYAAAFPVAAIEPRFARPLYRTLPRVFVLHEGVVTHTWSELPAPNDVVKALQQLPQRQETP
ncbi:MAG: MauE/DoxX family redox-associated membrane protein [Bacteroidota bacterium]|nr:MauE/DoxX family redox-associated membrane protein [Bacteroidota bacterium]